MLLRNKLSLIFSISIVVLILCVAWASREREQLAQTQFAAMSINTQAAFWNQLLREQAELLGEVASAMQRDDRFVAMVRAGDRSGIASTINQDLAHERDSLAVLDVATQDGDVLYSTGTDLEERILDLAALRDVAQAGKRSGLWPGDGGRYLIAYAFALPRGDGTSVIVTLGRDISATVAAFAQAIGTEAYIVNPRGRMLTGTNPEIWAKLSPNIPLRTSSVTTLSSGQRTYLLTSAPLNDLGGRVAGVLISVLDATDALSQSNRVGVWTVGGAVFFLIVLIVGLNVYLRLAFKPLDGAIAVLNAISRGDMSARIEHRGRDEIGRISDAIGHFRDTAAAIGQFRRQRARQRKRQERVIRGEMEQLATALDATGRAEIAAILESHSQKASRDIDEISNEGAQLALLTKVLGQLSGRITQQHLRLNELIADLKDSLVTKTKLAGIQQELEIARKVQLAMVPAQFPSLASVDVWGEMLPAKEVGGDFFDFFALDDDHYALMVGDVAGKGVPASLFMAISRTLLRATARYELDPARCIESVNNLLAMENNEMLFVTLFYGVLDVRTGTISYVNAGHNPPLVIDPDGRSAYMKGMGDMAIAVIEDQTYSRGETHLQLGQTLFIYTDGVTEAFDPDGRDYGEDRLQAMAGAISTSPSMRAAIGQVYRDIASFVKDAEQSDDITCLAIRYR